jgi:hypothetical protein
VLFIASFLKIEDVDKNLTNGEITDVMTYRHTHARHCGTKSLIFPVCRKKSWLESKKMLALITSFSDKISKPRNDTEVHNISFFISWDSSASVVTTLCWTLPI